MENLLLLKVLTNLSELEDSLVENLLLLLVLTNQSKVADSLMGIFSSSRFFEPIGFHNPYIIQRTPLR